MTSLCPSLDQVELNSEERRSVLCIGRDEEWITHLRTRLGARVSFASMTGEAVEGAKLDHVPLAPVIILDARLEDAFLHAVLLKCDAATPAPMVLLLGNAISAQALMSLASRKAYVRCLPDSVLTGLIEQMLEDGLERHRLLTAEAALSRELEYAQSQLEELSHLTTGQNLDSTATVMRLYHVVSGLNGLIRPEEVAKFVVTTAAGMARSRQVSLLMPDANNEFLTVVDAVGLEPEIIARTRIPIGKPICGEVFAQSKQVMIPYGHIPKDSSSREDFEILPRAPLISLALSGPERPLAVLNISEPTDAQAYTEESLAGLQILAETAAIVLANHIRGQERDEARDSIMVALAKLAESRDPETGKHLERVQVYCRLLAEELAESPKYRETITPDFIETLVRSSPLHDIGKVGVPDHILLKPGRLTEEEFEIMKRHTIIGGDTIKALIKQGRQREFLEMAMKIAYHHHEKYNGSGYPFGLKNEAIPLPARIMAVADVYDALTTARVYKKAIPHVEARGILLKGKGEHFDPDLVDAFLRRETEFEKLAVNLADILEADALG